VAPPSDPNLLWDTRHRLDEYDLLRPEEVETTVALLLTFTGSADHGRVEAALAPAVERFRALEGEDSAGCKDALDKFVRTYAFMAQIVTFGETKLERDYLFCRALATYLRSTATYERLDLGTEVELTHLRTEAQTEGALTLTSETGEVKWVTGDGMGSRHDPDVEPLSAIIHLLNDRYGLNLGDADQLLFDQYEEDWAAPGPQQHPRQLPPRLRPAVPQHRRQPHGRQRRHLQTNPRRPRLPRRPQQFLPEEDVRPPPLTRQVVGPRRG